MRRRRATSAELREGAREITQAHIRMQLEATEVPVEQSPATGLQEDPLLPSDLEMLPDALQAAEAVEAQLMGYGRAERLERRETVSGKGKGARDEATRQSLEAMTRTPQRRLEGPLADESGHREPQVTPVPLFDEAQLRRFEELYRRTPWLYPSQVSGEVGREIYQEEEKRMEQLRKQAMDEMREKELQQQRMREVEEKRRLQQRAHEERVKSDEEIQRMKERLAALEEENQLLRNKEAVELGRSSRFATPEDVVDDLGKRETDGNEESQQRYASGEKREGQPSQKEDKDDMKSILHGMVRLMEGMQAMQTQILDVKRHKDVEVVKSGVASLPRLPEWKADTAPLDLTDWFLTIEPAMGDLSDGSQQWWDGMLRAARSWYATHLEKTPLERVAHRPEVPRELQESKFQRLEKRAATLLMGAIPVSMQEEVVAGKDITTISILSKLMLSYQPGGLTEKSAILHALDSPEEAQGLTAAVMGLRRWLRWHRRAGEVGVVRPDATIQVKGLGRLMKKVLKDNNDLAFRIQLAKSSLQIDTTPTESSVMTFAHHLLAEVEQVAHQDKRKKDDKPTIPEPKVKRFEETKGDGKGAGRDRGDGPGPCRFFMSEGGCKKGKACTWPHILDDQRRCWTCGSTQHFSPNCDRPKEPQKDVGGQHPEKGGKSFDGKGGSIGYFILGDGEGTLGGGQPHAEGAVGLKGGRRSRGFQGG